MPKNLTGRTILIVGVLLTCLFILFPYAYRGNFRPNLRPGIDMVGGSSLLYQIKGAEDGRAPAADLAESTIKALRERVDPEGVKNLVWRAQGADKIEIQLPATAESESAAPIRKQFAEARAALDATNVRPAQVEALLRLPADQRDAALAALGQGSPTRAALLAEIAKQQRAIDDANKAQNAAAAAEAQVALDAAMAKLPATDVDVASLDAALADKAARATKLAAIKAADPGNAARDKAIDAYAEAYDKSQSVRNAVGDVAELKQLLKGSGVLSFHIAVKPADAGEDAVMQMVRRLQTDGPRARPGDDMAWIAVDRPQGNIGGNTIAQVRDGKTYLLVWMNAANSMRNRPGTPDWRLLKAYTARGQSGEPLVAFEFNPVGASLFGNLTGRHTPESPNGPFDLVAVLDNKVISNARINDRIGASGTISGGGPGGFSATELDYLVRTLNAGALPAQLAEEPLVERTVGPQLGADNLRAGFIACVFGILVVAVFLVGYYFLAGIVALVAMLLNVLLILAGMSAVGATFTLPSVAGIVLTVGVAVDANVLIFERLREEQRRGLSLRVALAQAYDQARSAILDSNVTAAITGVILFWIGSEDVKGFGLTLLLGIVSSLFTSLFVSKTIFAALIDRFHVDDLRSLPQRFPAIERMMHPKIDWIGKSWMFIAFSAVFIVVGFSTMFVEFRKGRLLDIEFAGGTIVQFNLKEPMAQEDVRHLIEAESAKLASGQSAGGGRLDAPSVQSVGDVAMTPDGKRGYTSYEVMTVTSDTNAVRTGLAEALSGKLNVAQAATFAGTGKPATEAGEDLVPIENDQTKVAGFTPREIGDFVGGAAIVLRDLQPMLAPADVRERLDEQRVTAAGSGGTVRYAVEPTPDGRGLVVLAVNPQALYDATNAAVAADWRQHVATPVWQAVQDAVGHPAEFGRVSSISQTIAGETSANAVVALITAVVLIVIYVWVRFGDLKYGGGTVVALAHDVLFMLASIGVAHLLSDTIVGRVLLLQPFRINLTMVSAILAIIGFSMSDTVVIFDRIRENRRRLNRLDRAVINDSINQTLSRTLLMAITTLATLFVMYVTGGEAIHGFAFALFFGLLTGVYSSIAIASPLLLLGKHVDAPANANVPVAKPVLP